MVDFDKKVSRFGTGATKWYVDGYDQEEVFPLTYADMELECADCICEAMRKRLEHKIFGYTYALTEEYKGAVKAWYKKRFDWDIDTEYLRVSHGVVDGFFRIIEAITKPDERIIIQTPCYPPFLFTKREHVENPLLDIDGDWKIDFEGLKRLCADKSNKVLLFCHPHNPTGRIWSEEELRAVADICFKAGVTIISDEIHGDLLRVGNTLTPFMKLFPDGDIISCISASKSFNLAGLDLANVLYNKLHKEQLLHALGDGANPLSLAAYIGAYTKEGEQWLEQLRRYLDGNFAVLKQFADERLPKSHYEIAQGTYLAWLNLKPYGVTDSKDFCRFFRERSKYLLADGASYRGEGYIRLNIACPVYLLTDMLNKLGDAIAEYENR
ncbi:MAG: aminotransferase class I/II-fold pyridoxal phosphate-dependent enzyme [Clostridia bacterium]|nr:aminotransferase class I/II-fold pyridoxal phosphate-dependent enzyme [Clostridia bacterium]